MAGGLSDSKLTEPSSRKKTHRQEMPRCSTSPGGPGCSLGKIGQGKDCSFRGSTHVFSIIAVRYAKPHSVTCGCPLHSTSVTHKSRKISCTRFHNVKAALPLTPPCGALISRLPSEIRYLFGRWGGRKPHWKSSNPSAWEGDGRACLSPLAASRNNLIEPGAIGAERAKRRIPAGWPQAGTVRLLRGR